jgi:anaerobic magnesium-protoporphyrin IX monomethyl ester cyclase
MRILLVVYDNDSYIHWFPQGLAYVAAVLQKKGYEVQIYNQDVHHYPDEHLTEFLNKNKFDIIGVSVIAGYYQYRKLLKISEAVNRSVNRPFFIIGGHGPSPEPEYFLKKTEADAAVIGEGENTIIELLEAFGNHRSFADIKGIAFRDCDQVHITPRRELIADIDQIPIPAYELFPIEHYRLMRLPNGTNSDFVMPVLSGRGCTFQCNFCYRMDDGFRARSNEGIIAEIEYLKSRFRINGVTFSDELLMSSKNRIVSLCEALIKSGLNIRWDCNGRLNYATPEILQLMKRAGCVFINYGIEAFDDQILKNMNKKLTTEQIEQGIKATLAAGISPGFNIIFGNIGENRKTLNQGVEFLLKYSDGAQMRTIRPVTPYPGSALYYYAIDHGLLKDVADFYEKKHVNSDLLAVNFTELTDEEFHEALLEANQRILKSYFQEKLASVLKQTEQLYRQKNVSFRGFRQT